MYIEELTRREAMESWYPVFPLPYADGPSEYYSTENLVTGVECSSGCMNTILFDYPEIEPLPIKPFDPETDW